MTLSYVQWALIGMAAYSFATMFVTLAERAGAESSFVTFAISTTIVALIAVPVAIARGEWRPFVTHIFTASTAWACAAGVAIAIAVMALFKGLSAGPASVVVPIYGMFIVGAAILDFTFLQEPFTWTKAAGIAVAAAGVFLITR